MISHFYMIKLLILTIFFSFQVEAKTTIKAPASKPLSSVEISYGTRYRLNKAVSDIKFVLTPNPLYFKVWVNDVKKECSKLKIECQIFASANNPQLINIYSIGRRTSVINFMSYLKSISANYTLKK